MNIAFTIPAWLLWALGIIGGFVLLVLAAFGVWFLIYMRELGRTMNRHFGW